MSLEGSESEIDLVNKLFPNVDKWGALEWFDRLAMAVREQDKAVAAGDEISFDTYRMIAASSAMRLVRDYEEVVRTALKGSEP